MLRNWKKYLWRAVRGSVYTALSVVIGKYAQEYGLDPTLGASLSGAILAALDKLFGIGALVKYPDAQAQ